MSKKSNLPVRAGTQADYKMVGALNVSLVKPEISIDASRLQAPSRSYSADTGWVTYTPGQLSLYFAKRDITGPAVLPSRLEIRMPAEDFLRLLVMSRSFYKLVRRQTDQWNPAVLQVSAPPVGVRAERTHSEWANFCYAAFSGSSASLDFHQMSIPGIARYSKNRDISGLSLTPVLRVQLSLFELLRLLDEGYALEGKIREDAPEEVRKLADELAADDDADEQ